MRVAAVAFSGLSTSTRVAILDALEKDELLDLCDLLALSPRSYSDQHSVAQQIASNEYKVLELEIEIHRT